MRIAVVGSGIAGLTAAYLLRNKHEVTVFEKEDWIGGHTHTLEIPEEGKTLSIDTGFIVFNNKTYPNFTKLLRKLKVEKQDTNMSFSVRNQDTGLEYNGTNLNGIFAQRKNLLNVKFLKMLKEILTLNTIAKTKAEEFQYLSLQDFITKYKLSGYVVENYLLPMCCSIWSSEKDKILQTPAKFLFDFLNNHGMLNVNDRPDWYVVKGGSHSYVKQMQKEQALHFKHAEVIAVTRANSSVQIKTKDEQYNFDKVILATHADISLKLLTDKTELETQMLTAFPYQDNSVILHTDIGVLPQNKRAWACWNFLSDKQATTTCQLSYNMNMLQTLDAKQTYVVSVNQDARINEDKILARFKYAHPTFIQAGFAAQPKQQEISGHNNTYFCGAYWGYGFHEDGVKSALHIVKDLDGESLDA